MRRVGNECQAEETYNCFARCLKQDGITDLLEQRKRWRCALPGFPERHWDKPPKPLRHMGLMRVLPTDTEHPPEPLDDGCPGAWYRCAFVLSLHKYERPLTEHGFSDNLLTSRSDDRLLLEALSYYEREKLRARARDLEIMHSKK